MKTKTWLPLLILFLGTAGLMLATAPLVKSNRQERYRNPTDVNRPLFAEMIARAGQHRTPEFLPYLVRYRFFPCLLFAGAVAATWGRMRTTYPSSIAWVAVVALLVMPRQFAAAHTATTGAVAASAVLLAWALFPSAMRNLFSLLAWVGSGAVATAATPTALLLLPLTAAPLLANDRDERRLAARTLGVGMLGVLMLFGTYLGVLRYDPDFTRTSIFDEMWAKVTWYTPAELGAELLCVPEWHLIFALVAVVFGLRHYSQDTDRFVLIVLALATAWFLEGPGRLIFIGPLAAVGVGRLLYRGTLNKPFRIPPANWAMVLLAIATVRSGVIMATWAPGWHEYQNRVGLMVEERSKP